MAKRKLSKEAAACVSREIEKHCRKKKGKGCKRPSARKQAVAIGFAVCRRNLLALLCDLDDG